jgi:Rha family phage regulatory protein
MVSIRTPAGVTEEVSAKTVTMSSLEIAELTGKRHDNVLADIRNMLEELAEGNDLKFQAIYHDSRNRQKVCFNLPRREVGILLTGYSVPLRAKCLDRLHELEEQARSGAQSSQPQPAVGSKAWQKEREAGKVQRLSLTDTIRDYLIPLATEQGSSSPKMLYQVYSQMVNQALDYPAGQRDVMAVADLNRLEAVEEFAAQQIITLSLANLHYKKVYELVKAAVARFVGSLPVLRPIRLALN